MPATLLLTKRACGLVLADEVRGERDGRGVDKGVGEYRAAVLERHRDGRTLDFRRAFDVTLHTVTASVTQGHSTASIRYGYSLCHKGLQPPSDRVIGAITYG